MSDVSACGLRTNGRLYGSIGIRTHNLEHAEAQDPRMCQLRDPDRAALHGREDQRFRALLGKLLPEWSAGRCFKSTGTLGDPC